MRHKNQIGAERADRSDPLNSEFDIDNDGSHRRRANDALRALIRLLDTSSLLVTQNLFSCESCERTLSADDCAELGISAEEGQQMKRLRAVVIDGTASGIFTELPLFDRNNVNVPGPKSMSAIYKSQKLLKRHSHRRALRKLFKTVQQCLRDWKKLKERQSPFPIVTSQCEPLRIWIRKSDNIPIKGIQDPADTFTESESRIVQLFLSDHACFCPRTEFGDHNIPQAVEGQHASVCKLVRNFYAKAKESDIINNVIRILFSTTEGNAKQILHQTDDRLEEAENRHENEDLADGGQANAQVNSTPTSANDENNDTAAETGADEGTDGRSASDDEYAEDYESIETQRRQMTGFWVTLDLPGPEYWSQFVESTFLLLEFILTDHMALPYVGNGALSHSSTTELPSSTEKNMLDFTEHSLKLNEALARDLEKYANPCTETCENRNTSDCECRSRLKVSLLPICRVSPNLSTFCQELIKLKKRFKSIYHQLLKSIVAVLNYHIEIARRVFKNMQ